MTWQTEFDEMYQHITNEKNKLIYKGYQYVTVHACIKAFIQDLLDRKAREIAEHGYRKNEPGWEKISTEVKFYGMGYNDALDQALSILKEEE